MEATFQKIVLTIAIVLLIILLIVINMSLSSATESMIWPPITTDCPDYWEDLLGNGSRCFNSKNIGKCNPRVVDSAGKPVLSSTKNFNRPQFTGETGVCAKQRWAKTCGVAWDGITYGYGSTNPCDIKVPV